MGIVDRMKSKAHGNRGLANAEAMEAYLGGGFRNVSGWLSLDALLPIKELAKRQVAAGVSGGVAEIGVHHGQLFIYLCLLTAPGEKAVGVDLFERQEENTDGSGEGDRDVVSRNLSAAGADLGRVELVGANSLDITSDDIVKRIGGPVRLFSVDGGHTPELTRNDLEIALGCLAPGGVIILDDVFSQMWPGVGEGLRAFMDANPGAVVPFGLVGNKTLLTQPAYHGTHLTALNDLVRYFQNRQDRFYGSEVRILMDLPA